MLRNSLKLKNLIKIINISIEWLVTILREIILWKLVWIILVSLDNKINLEDSDKITMELKIKLADSDSMLSDSNNLNLDSILSDSNNNLNLDSMLLDSSNSLDSLDKLNFNLDQFLFLVLLLQLKKNSKRLRKLKMLRKLRNDN